MNSYLNKQLSEILQINRTLTSFKVVSSFKADKNNQFHNDVEYFPPLPAVFNKNKNVWLYKPCNQNRGRGVQVFQSLEELEQIIVQGYVADGSNSSVLQQRTLLDQGKFIGTSTSSMRRYTGANNSHAHQLQFQNKFIVQKYMERPLLINSRKFDMRIWALLHNVKSEELQLYMFKECYLRTSSQPFELGKKSLKNKLIHLTNNAIQKFGKNYGQFEDGNQMNYAQLKRYLESGGYGANPFEKIYESFVQLIVHSMKSVKNKINKFNRKNCFEIFGYDFLIDEELKVWLVEINTNPCIEESSDILKMLLPRMIGNPIFLKTPAHLLGLYIKFESFFFFFYSHTIHLSKLRRCTETDNRSTVSQSEPAPPKLQLLRRHRLQQHRKPLVIQFSSSSSYKLPAHCARLDGTEIACNTPVCQPALGGRIIFLLLIFCPAPVRLSGKH